MSDIFNKYAELAIERNLIKNAESPEKKLEKNPRMDSLDLSAIEALYGVKPETVKEMSYEKNIAEVAHPNPVIIAPSYDKLNGLVENVNELNNILINIVKKPTNGHITGKKYASDQLTMSLVRIANDMDNKNIDELRALADTCLEQLYKEADFFDKFKDFFSGTGKDVVETGEGALAGSVLGGVIGGLIGNVPGAMLGAKIGGAAGGLVAALAKTSPSATSVSFNAQDSIEQINDLVSKNPSDKFLPALQKQLKDLIEISKKFAELSKDPNGTGFSQASAEQLTASYVSSMENMKKSINVFNSKVKLGDYSEEDSGLTSKLKDVFHMFVADDVQDVVNSLNSLKISINKAEDGIKELKKASLDAMNQAAQTAQANVPAQMPADASEDEKKLAEILANHPELLATFKNK